MPRNGESTRSRILERATHVASARGLGALTVGGVASEAGVSKGAVANHFPSKLDLQLATIEAAAHIAQGCIADGTLGAAPGLPRLQAALGAWLDYLAHPPFEGGCFFCTTTVESGITDGAVRDALALAARFGLDMLTEQAGLAQRLGEIDDDTSPEQLVFELHAFLQEANWSRRLLDDPNAIEHARSAINDRLSRRKQP